MARHDGQAADQHSTALHPVSDGVWRCVSQRICAVLSGADYYFSLSRATLPYLAFSRSRTFSLPLGLIQTESRWRALSHSRSVRCSPCTRMHARMREHTIRN